MTLGISGDMLIAACYSFMERSPRDDFLKRVGAAAEGLGGSVSVRETRNGSAQGHTFACAFPEGKGCTTAEEAGNKIRRIAHDLNLTASGGRFAEAVFSDIIEAEAAAHGINADAVHLHEIGRPAGLFNMAAIGLCHNLLGLGDCEIIGSAISVGRGKTMTDHGLLTVPTPASLHLLTGLKSRSGPFEGEMATPTGIAIAKNLISKQIDSLPAHGRQGIGFGSKSFEGVVGYTRLFEKVEPINEGG